MDAGLAVHLALTIGLLPIPVLRRHLQGLVPETGGSETHRRPAAKVRCVESHASSKGEGMLPEELQEFLWPQFFAHPTEWWDYRQSKPSPRHPDFRHKKSKLALWLNSRHKPAWVDSRLATMTSGTKKPGKPVISISIQEQGASGRERPLPDQLDVGICRKLCEQGRVTEAVDALNFLVQRGCNVEKSLFYRVLKCCIAQKDLFLGRRIHALTVECGLQGDAFLATHLIGLYAWHGRLEEAMRVFTKVSPPSIYNWATIIFAYSRHGKSAKAIQLYRLMRESTTVKPDDHIYSAVLKACAASGDLHAGKEVHSHILASPGTPDVFVHIDLVEMYSKCRSLEDARRVFDIIPERNVVTWNALLAGYAHQGMGEEALSLYNSMQQEGITPPNSVTFLCLLKACASVGAGALQQGKQLHAQIVEQGLQDEVIVGCSLVNMYAKCGSLVDARNVFEQLPDKNVVTWTAIIAGYVQQGLGEEALTLYTRMQQEGITPPDSVAFVCLLQACASVGVGALHHGNQLRVQIERRGLQDEVVLGGSLVSMYTKCGSLVDARNVFDKLPEKNVVTWTAMIAGYVQQGMGQEALTLYASMQQEGITPPDSVTFLCILQACASVGVGALHYGKHLHAQIKEQRLQSDVVLGGSLVNMYAKCGSLEDAHNMFEKLPDKNVFAWTTMIAGYVQQGSGQEALTLYTRMQDEGITPPDSVTFVCLLQACAIVGVEALHHGRQLHAQIEERGLEDDAVVCGSLVNMYAKGGSLEDARWVFDRLRVKDVVTWNAMITGYSQLEMGKEALSVYRIMQQESITPPDSVTFVCLLQACAVVAALPLGQELHDQIEERSLQTDLDVAVALINMYAKCGSMYDSQEVFDSLPERTIEAWNALTGGYMRQGDSDVVFDSFDMIRMEGIQPDGVTFLSVLSVCSHVGLVDKGRNYFEAMSTEYGIRPTIEHYTCMMDLLGRAGHLDEALQIAKTMPFPADGAVWLTLLGACRKWDNVEIGKCAFEGALSVGGKDASSFVLMSNIYASAQMLEEAKEIQAMRKKLGAWKEPGQSWWTDMCGVVHTFVVGDKNHPECEGIYARLEQLIPNLKNAGYEPHLHSSLWGISDDEKEAELWSHSEKLAIAYALNKTSEGEVIRVVKNLRVCVDCHTATAYISKLEKRTIICRDANRFHIYKEGKCSCGDYW